MRTHVIVVLFLALLCAAILLLIRSSTDSRPKATIVRHGLDPEGAYVLKVNYENIPYPEVYVREVATRPLKDGTVSSSPGITRQKVTGSTHRATYSFDTARFLEEYRILRPSGRSTVHFSDGKREIKVFRGRSASGERYEAFIGIGSPISHEGSFRHDRSTKTGRNTETGETDG